MFKLNVGVVLGIVLFAAPAWSSLITVNNGSFENPFLVKTNPNVVSSYANGLFEFGDLMAGSTIPDWHINSGASSTGVFQPTVVGPFALNAVSPVPTGPTGVPDGFQVGFLRSGGSIYQDLTPITGYGYYSVTVDVGHRTDIPSGAYSLILSSGSTELARFDGNTSSIAPGGGGMASGYWAPETVTYNGAATPSSLRLTLEAPAGQVTFDNVEAVGAPEIGGPAVFWTMFGVAGFWIYRKKRSVA